MQDSEFRQSSHLMNSMELRQAALNLSQKRGHSVASRRIARRWIAWFVWGCILPIIGLITLIAGIMTSVLLIVDGPSSVIEKTQSWLQEQRGLQEQTSVLATPAYKANLEKSDGMANQAPHAALAEDRTAILDNLPLQIDPHLDLKKSNILSQNVEPASVTTATAVDPKSTHAFTTSQGK